MSWREGAGEWRDSKRNSVERRRPSSSCFQYHTMTHSNRRQCLHYSILICIYNRYILLNWYSTLFLHGNTDVNGAVVARRRIVGFNFEAAVTVAAARRSSHHLNLEIAYRRCDCRRRRR